MGCTKHTEHTDDKLGFDSEIENIPCQVLLDLRLPTEVRQEKAHVNIVSAVCR